LEVRPARVHREYLKNTYNAHGYHCQPMTNANTHGWEILLPHDVEIIWDGVTDSGSEHVKILKGEYLENGMKIADTGTANALITFNLQATVETHPDYYAIISGPPNFFIDGVKPMTGLIRTDWYSHNPIQHSWMITTPNKKITFPKGTPFAFFSIYPKNLLESTKFTVRQMNEEEKREIGKYATERDKFYEAHKDEFKWTHMYRDGKKSMNDPYPQYNKPYRPQPSKVEYL
jgi:hypothetical protein